MENLLERVFNLVFNKNCPSSTPLSLLVVLPLLLSREAFTREHGKGAIDLKVWHCGSSQAWTTFLSEGAALHGREDLQSGPITITVHLEKLLSRYYCS